MMTIEDPAVLDEVVNKECSSPSACKRCDDRTIYLSADLGLPDGATKPIISDFGDAHFGDPPFYSEVMPDLYRAPEIILAIAWDEKIDIWAFGLMVLHPSHAPY
jgi:hypothetical protein